MTEPASMVLHTNTDHQPHRTEKSFDTLYNDFNLSGNTKIKHRHLSPKYEFPTKTQINNNNST